MAARTAALRVLEGLDDPRAQTIALGALESADRGVIVAALAVLRGWVEREEGVGTLDAVTAIALDPARDGDVRHAALDALSELPRDLVAPIIDRARDRRSGADDPDAARAWLAGHGPAAALSAIHDLIMRIRDRERAEPEAHRRHEWLIVRGTAHALLAQRGSRVALYDLREAFDAAPGPLPLDFLTAVIALGDASCLEPMARAWSAAPGEAWWRGRLAEAAADIMRRERLNARSSVIRRIRSKWEGFL
jgi:hypothetical protein